MVVSGEGGWSVALRLEALDYAVDVSTSPARFGVRTSPDCLDGPLCPVAWYSWTGTELAPA